MAAAGIIAATIGALAIVWALASGDDGARDELDAVAQPTPQRIAATSVCGQPASATCVGEWEISPEAGESGLRLSFTVTFRSETDCVASWRSDSTASTESFNSGREDRYVVIDANNATQRLASLTDELPCNIPQLGWWQFDAVPPGPATFHYPDFAEPVGFVVPAAPTPVAPAAAE